MIRRIAPSAIMARRLSLPYSRQALPKLLPKPNIARKVPPTQISTPNGALLNVHRISPQNIVLNSSLPSFTSTSTTQKATLRPLPGLTKVVSKVGNISKLIVSNGQSNVAKKNFVMIRKSLAKSMRPSPSPSTSTSAQLNRPNQLTSIKFTAPPEWTPVKYSQAARMPPTLTPAPRSAKLPVKTYSRNGIVGLAKLPIISQVQSIVSQDQNNHGHTAPLTHARTYAACTSKTIQSAPRHKMM